MGKNRILVIAPHADDEILGCGATMAKHVKNGDQVRVVVATNASLGAPELFSEHDIFVARNEAEKAHKLLGVDETIFMDFPAPALNAHPSYKISLGFAKVINSYKPSHLYIPHPGDLHLDHDAVYRSALVAARPQGDWKVNNIYCYETLSETEWAPNQGAHAFIPNHFVNVTEYFSKKIEAISCFASQLKSFPHSRSKDALKSLAEYRGATVGVRKAEAFEVERQILL